MKSTRDDPDVGRFPQPFVFTPIGEKTKVGMRSDFIYDADPLYQALIDKFDGITEIGQNSSGMWIIFSSGLMCCIIRHIRTNVAVSAAWGNIYGESSNTSVSLPKLFNEVYGAGGLIDSPSANTTWLGVTRCTSTSLIYECLRGTAATISATALFIVWGTPA